MTLESVLRAVRKYQKKIVERNWAIKLGPWDRLQCPYCNYVWFPRNFRVPKKCPNCQNILVKVPRIIRG
jgi:predicted Zn-ribbon and HTH transcriptional regulator